LRKGRERESGKGGKGPQGEGHTDHSNWRAPSLFLGGLERGKKRRKGSWGVLRKKRDWAIVGARPSSRQAQIQTKRKGPVTDTELEKPFGKSNHLIGEWGSQRNSQDFKERKEGKKETAVLGILRDVIGVTSEGGNAIKLDLRCRNGQNTLSFCLKNTKYPTSIS